MGTYHSTRGRTLSCSSKVAIRTGIAPAEGAKARVLLSTASPYKFPRACCEALGLNVPEDDFEAMRVLEQATNTVAPTQLAELESKPVRFEDVCDVDEMASYVESAAKKMATN